MVRLDAVSRPRAASWPLLAACGVCFGCAHGPRPEGAAEAWTLAVLPDTQVYARQYPDLFRAQTRWIAENYGQERIRFVVHEGDVVDDNNHAQWRVAQESLALLDGRVPYAIAPGNHDYGPNGDAANRTTLLHEYFPPATFEAQETFGGWFESGRVDNSYHLLEGGGRQWLILLLEFGPRSQVIDWANRILGEHRERTAIVVTHAYLCALGELCDAANDAQLYNPHGYGLAELEGGVHDGQELYDALIARNDNVAIVLCGHVAVPDGGARRTRVRPSGRPVHEILANYQAEAEGGGGWLRLMEFSADGRAVKVRTLSPGGGVQPTGSAHEFSLQLPEG